MTTGVEFDIGVILVTTVIHAWLTNGERDFAVRYRMRINKEFSGYAALLLYRMGLTLCTWTLGFMCLTVSVKYVMQQHVTV